MSSDLRYFSGVISLSLHLFLSFYFDVHQIINVSECPHVLEKLSKLTRLVAFQRKKGPERKPPCVFGAVLRCHTGTRPKLSDGDAGDVDESILVQHVKAGNGGTAGLVGGRQETLLLLRSMSLPNRK